MALLAKRITSAGPNFNPPSLQQQMYNPREFASAPKAVMAQSLSFDKALHRALFHGPRGYTWLQPWRADKRSIVDVAGFEGRRLDEDELVGKIPRVLVEVELKKDNPVENVVKIWHWGAQRNKTAKRILFVHAFSAHYLVEDPTLDRSKAKDPPKTKQHERAVFIGELMKKDRTRRIDYEELPIYTTTRAGKRKLYKPLMRRGYIVKAGGGAMGRAAKELAKDIAKLLRTKSYC